MDIEFTKNGVKVTDPPEEEREWLWSDISRISVVAKTALKCIVRYLAVENTTGDFVEISSDNKTFETSIRELTELGAVDEDIVVSVATLLPSEGRVSLYEGTG